MITERDLDAAIAECQGEPEPNANTCLKLAAFYTIKNEMYGKPAASPMSVMPSTYSMQYATAQNIVDYISDSEFSRAINGRSSTAVFALMDELMDTLAIVNPRLYDNVMRKLQ